MNADVVVEVRDLAVAYGSRTVLRGVDLIVRTGEVVALLGANGSGKSTLVRAILGLVPLAHGKVSLFGVAADTRALRRQRYRIGYVPQRLGAGGGVPATAVEVVESGRLARRGMLRPAGSADRGAALAALAAVGLAECADTPVASLSGGQQQRTLIARALAAEPELLVLDEPTAGVDAASQEAFAQALRAFVSGGRTRVAPCGTAPGTGVAPCGTVLLVAHELGPLEPLVTRAVVIHDSTVAHDGPVPPLAGQHAKPGHDHVHPHETQPVGMWQ